MTTLNRRQFIGAMGAAGVAFLAPPTFASTARGRVVVLLELSGGNDGLNTVIPTNDPRYQALRPSLAIGARERRKLDDATALHPALEGLSVAWEAGDLAIVEGVGYPNPNRSHFRSIEIWEGGTDADEYDERGWLARVFRPQTLGRRSPAALTIGANDDGPLAGSGALAMTEPEALFGMVRRLERVQTQTTNPALDHVLQTQNELLDAVETLKRYSKNVPTFGRRFPRNPAARPVELAAQMIAAGLPVYAIRLRVGGFDTHVNQRARHTRLLEGVDQALAAFRTAMKDVGRWDDVVVVTYSEFGRRPRENGGGGTDHGTAAPHFVMGGRVQGGRYGTRPSLDDLDPNGDLIYTTDFRRVYATIAEKWWKVADHEFKDFSTIPMLKG